MHASVSCRRRVCGASSTCPVFFVSLNTCLSIFPSPPSSSSSLSALLPPSGGAVLPDEGRGVQVQPGVRLHRAHLHHHHPKPASLRQVTEQTERSFISVLIIFDIFRNLKAKSGEKVWDPLI